MKFNIARQPLIPAFLTLAALAAAAMWGVCAHTGSSATLAEAAGSTADVGRNVSDAIAAAVRNGTDGLVIALPGELLAQFQSAHPGWSRWIGGLLILFTGLCAGRLTVRYNLYSVGTCLAIPLFGAVACGLTVAGDYLTAFTAAALLALVLKNYARSFCNGFGFDAIFRASLYLGLLPLVTAASLPLLLLLPLAVLLFRRTLREVTVAAAGLLLPALTLCYINWGAGGGFLAPVEAMGHSFLAGTPLSLFTAMPMRNLIQLGGILLLDLLALLFFLSDIYAVGTKARFVFIFNISILILTAALLCGPAATPGLMILVAVASAVLLPFMFVRIHRGFALILYLLLLASAVIGAVLQ